MIIKKMFENGIEFRPIWKLNHMQDPYINCQSYEVSNAKLLLENSLCLPSSVNISDKNLYKIVEVLKK